MTKYLVVIHETRSYGFHVDALDTHQAVAEAQRLWEGGETGDPEDEDSVGWEVAQVQTDRGVEPFAIDFPQEPGAPR